MNKLIKNQHYIPRSYLKNFGYLVNTYTRPNGKVDEKWSVFNIEHGSDIKHNSTKKICKMEYLYDLPFANEQHRQIIEREYGDKIDRYFSEVTSFIQNDEELQLSEEMREKILKCSLSLYFRTPKHIAITSEENEKILSLPINSQEKKRNELKTKKLLLHLKNFNRLYYQKRNCGISINKAVEDWDFISGDNPVIFRGGFNHNNNVFDSEKTIHIPFTPKYCITIFPESEVKGFVRYKYTNLKIMTINHDIEKHHDKYIFGSKIALQYYLDESPFYKAPCSENHPLINELKEKSLAFKHCLEVAENFGLMSQETKQTFMYYWENVISFRNDPNSIDLKKTLNL